MRILLVNQFFWPDVSATSQLLTDLARALDREGHQVTVICGESDYAGPRLGSRPAARVVRAWSSHFTKGSSARRLLSYVTFLASAALRAFRVPKPDVVITLTTPPFVGLTGTVMKALRGCRHYIWEMDMYPDVAVDIGMLRADSLVTRISGRVADFIRSRADGIIALGECMKTRLIGRGVPEAKIVIADNWADGTLFGIPRPNASLPLNILYPGNLGLGHDVDTLAAALQVLNNDDRLRFVFVGGGNEREALVALCREQRIANVEFHPYESPADLVGKYLRPAHVGLVTQSETCSGSIVPSKIYGLMAAGRPLLFIGPRTATPALVIRRFRCGWHVDPGDSVRLVNVLRSLADDPRLAVEAGRRAREAFFENYNLPIGVARVMDAIGARAPAAAAAGATAVNY
jgi:glycosyltransferase involved in cell wall biosynthesis